MTLVEFIQILDGITHILRAIDATTLAEFIQILKEITDLLGGH
jgi:hypothetical protein